LIATEAGLGEYLADLVQEIERFAVTLLPPNDDPEEIALGRDSDGAFLVDLECRPPIPRRSADVVIELFERWEQIGAGRYERTDYKFELRDHELQFRRAFHRHDSAQFLRALDVATHEHCEATLGVALCDHYFGEPVPDARSGFLRLYDLWLTNQQPDCSKLRCLDAASA
jgi:hypothetical protein